MKNSLFVLISVMMSCPCLAAVGGSVSVPSAQCGHCAAPVSAGNEMGQGITGYARQVQRGLEPAVENAPPGTSR